MEGRLVRADEPYEATIPPARMQISMPTEP